MVIWCITGIDSLDWLQNTRNNFIRTSQNIDARLILVENGSGINTITTLFDNEILLKSEPGVSSYINTGLYYIRHYGNTNDWFCKFDSDDFYGESYLRDILSLSNNGAKAVGSASLFVKTESDKLLFVDAGYKQGDVLYDPPHGPTLSSQIDVALNFPIPPDPWGEDMLWYESMKNAGVQFISRQHYGFAYCRYNHRQHTFPPREGELRHCWTAPTFDIGPWNESVVEGYVPMPCGVDIPFDEWKMMDAAEYMLEMKLKKAAISSGL